MGVTTEQSPRRSPWLTGSNTGRLSWRSPNRPLRIFIIAAILLAVVHLSLPLSGTTLTAGSRWSSTLPINFGYDHEATSDPPLSQQGHTSLPGKLAEQNHKSSSAVSHKEPVNDHNKPSSAAGGGKSATGKSKPASQQDKNHQKDVKPGATDKNDPDLEDIEDDMDFAPQPTRAAKDSAPPIDEEKAKADEEFPMLVEYKARNHPKKPPPGPETPISVHQVDPQMKADFAYALYGTDEYYLCSAVMMVFALQAMGSQASRVLMFPEHWLGKGPAPPGTAMLLDRALFAGATLHPVPLQHYGTDDKRADSFMKFNAWNLTQFKRVLALDSDATVISNLDDMFSSPPATLAAPQTYWLSDRPLSSQFLLVEPSEKEFERVEAKLRVRVDGEFDAEVVNQLYGDSATVLPYRQYNVQSGEFRTKNHTAYFKGTADPVWNATAELAAARYVHFRDWAVQKPMKGSDSKFQHSRPPCRPETETEEEDCSDQDAWLWLYTDFRERRKKVCEP